MEILPPSPEQLGCPFLRKFPLQILLMLEVGNILCLAIHLRPSTKHVIWNGGRIILHDRNTTSLLSGRLISRSLFHRRRRTLIRIEVVFAEYPAIVSKVVQLVMPLVIFPGNPLNLIIISGRGDADTFGHGGRILLGTTFAWVCRCINVKVEICRVIDVTEDIVVFIAIPKSCVTRVIAETRVDGVGTAGEIVAGETEFVGSWEGSVECVGEVDVYSFLATSSEIEFMEI